MIILGVDTAGRTMGVAVMRDDTLLYESHLATGLTHSETLMPAIDTALKSCGLRCADVDLFGVTAGPGSFTGLRIGLSTVKGLAFPCNAACAGVSTLEALALSHVGEGTVLPALDARRGEVYCAAFDLATHERLMPDSAMPASALEEFVCSYKKPLFFVGDGSALCYTKFKNIPGVISCPASLSAGRGVGICLAAKAMAARGETCSSSALLPDYHRLSQAERERAEKLSKNEINQ